MFDIGFWELVVIAIIALLVIGPERLPQFARDAGRLVGQFRRYVQKARKEIEKELALDQVNDLQKDISHLDNLLKEAPDRIRNDGNNGSST